MANKFLAGMTNFIEVLNQMWDAFAAGPYNSLPLTGGNLTGPVTSSSTIQASRMLPSAVQVGGVFTDTTLNTIAALNPVQGSTSLILRYGASFYVASGGGANAAATVLSLTSNTVTGRSLSTSGTLNASGADYAEYLIKSLLCGTIFPGQIVGIDAQGKLTDKWDLAISFAVKSTNPCMVGGDSWAEHLGERPVVPAPPTAPERQDNQTDEQWVEVLADAHLAQQDYAVELAAAQVAQQEFDGAFEQVRQTVDRIAFAGQVPVNLLGATPGQFIVPVQDGDGIGGMAVDKSDMTLDFLMDAIGRVIAIEDDGRARVIVKVT